MSSLLVNNGVAKGRPNSTTEEDVGDEYETSESRRQIGLVSAIFLYGIFATRLGVNTTDQYFHPGFSTV
jgi:hypothetical protein